ncbi:MAG: sensor histidine kinase, partial [Caldilineae bacterium]
MAERSSSPRPSHQILTIAEEELSRIVLDIHDGPVQYLFTALSLLTRLQQRIEADPGKADLAPELAQLGMLLESSLYEIRSFLGAFRPPGFKRRSLRAVIEGLALQHEESTGNRVELTVENVPKEISLPVKITLYRILQEALANAYHHAQVDTHYVRLWSEEDCICLEVIDHGQGFNPPSLDAPSPAEFDTHIGLLGMRERVALV